MDHDSYLDSLTEGNIVVLPIFDLKQCKDWQQGDLHPYDLLIVANNEDSYDWMAVNQLSEGTCKAEPDDIAKATELANHFIKGLLDLTLHDTIPDVPPPTEDATIDEKKLIERIEKKRDQLKATRKNIYNTKVVKLPEARDPSIKPVLKISLTKWPFDKYPDPYLVALKGAINLYYEGSGILKHKLRPACPTESSEECSSSSEVGCPGLSLFSYLPTVVNVVTDDDSDNVSVLSGSTSD